MEPVRAMALLAAPTDLGVVITGESGTGKEMLARALHVRSGRRTEPFVAVNVAALPDGLFEAELFGAEPGAYTGIGAARVGHFERARGGTVLLDEIGELRPDQQAKLLRVLQDGAVTRLGGETLRQVHARVVAATNRDLVAMVRAGTFRADLYFRLAVVELALPPLRARLEDMGRLVERFFREAVRDAGCPSAAGVSAGALAALCAYGWPGNVRELRNVVQRLAIAADGGVVEAAHVATALPSGAAARGRAGYEGRPMTLEATVQAAIDDALAAEGGDARAAARRLGVSRATVYRRARRQVAGGAS
jgi:two-component system response regulator AtoC